MKSTKVLLIYNPFSGNCLFKNSLDYVIEKFQAKGMQIIPYRTSKIEALEEMLSHIELNEYKKVIIAGGDGTINQVVNGLLKNQIDVPIAIFPVGTANDFATYFNIPNTVKEYTKIALSEHYTHADIGLVNDMYFVNVASLGFLIDISQRTDSWAKNTLGVLSYYLKGIEEFANIKPINVQVESAEYNFEGEIYFMLIMNGKSAGGFKKIAPKASASDGLFDIIIFKKCPIFELMPLVVQVLKGEHTESQHVVHFQTPELNVNCDVNAGTDMDGEKGADFPLHIKVIPKHIKINTKLEKAQGTND